MGMARYPPCHAKITDAASSGVEETSRIACAIFTLVSIGLLLFTGSSWSIADRTFIIAVK
jgi:hypothetical protein